MRITQSSMMRNYISNLRGSISNLSKSNEKLTTLSKYSRASENTSAAARALVVREQMYKGEQYISNIEDAEGELSSAEGNLRTINSLLQTVQERVLRGMNGGMDADDRKVMAKEIDNMKEQILQSINGKFGSRFVFASSNNTKAPFSTDANGALLYHDINVKDIFKDSATGKLMYPNPAYDASIPDSAEFLAVPGNKDVYVDVGLGLLVSGSQTDPKSALKISTSGIESLGFGDNNVFNLLTEISQSFEKNDLSSISDKLGKLTEHTSNIMLHVTDIGSRVSYLQHNKERIESEIFQLKEKQTQIEAIDIEFEAINNKSYEMAWMINLQLGSQIIPPSIFDFMR